MTRKSTYYTYLPPTSSNLTNTLEAHRVHGGSFVTLRFAGAERTLSKGELYDLKALLGAVLEDWSKE